MKKEVVYSDHALQRMKQRGITKIHVEQVLLHSLYSKKSSEGRKETVGTVENRTIKIISFETENYLKIITII